MKMEKWDFLKQPEFRVTTGIAIILAFIGGFFADKKQVIQYSPGSIVTRDQNGNNQIEQNLDINEYPRPFFDYEITSANQLNNDGIYETNVTIEYHSAPGVPLVPFNIPEQFTGCEQIGKTNKALMPVNEIETWTTANYVCYSKEPVVIDKSIELFKLAD